jgi:hypothetical protein
MTHSKESQFTNTFEGSHILGTDSAHPLSRLWDKYSQNQDIKSPLLQDNAL